MTESQFLHGSHIDWLNIIFPSKNFIEYIVSKNLIIFNNTTHLQFLNTECNVKFFRLIVPNKTVNLESQNSLGKFIKICHFLVVYFDFEDNNRFSDWFWFFSFGSWRSSWLCCRFCWSIVISERIEIIILLLFLLFLLFFIFFVLFLVVFTFVLVCPDLDERRTEVAYEKVPKM